jgi:hypothetical protein
VYAATHSIVIALGAPAGLVMLPIAAAALSARVTYQKLEESSEYHTLTERDLIKKYSQGQILEHIGKSTHLTNVNWAQDFFLSDEMAHKANETARNMGYRAYCAQIAAERVPPASVLDIDPDTLADLQQRGVQDARRPDGKTNLEALLENEQRNRISAFVGAAERYIAYRTQNTFDLVTPDVLRNATLYAEIQFEKFDKTSLPEFKPWNDTSYWAEAERWIAERSAVVTQAMTQGLCTLSARPAEFERDAPSRLLGMIRDEMAMCERRILVADYPNWELPNWWPSQWYGEASMQMIARGVVSEELWKELRRVTSGVREGRAITPADVSVSVQHLRDILLQDPIQCAQKGIQSSEAGYYRHAGEFPARLSVSGMLDLVNSYRLSPPTSPGVSPSTALPLTNVEFYAREGLPFILELQPGQKNGFFLVAESYMMKPSKPGYEPREIGPGVSYTGQLTLQAGEYQFWRKGHSTSKKADFMLLLREKRA